jgi:hypothetical protein
MPGKDKEKPDAKPKPSAYDKILQDIMAAQRKMDKRIDELAAEIARVREARGKVMM